MPSSSSVGQKSHMGPTRVAAEATGENPFPCWFLLLEAALLSSWPFSKCTTPTSVSTVTSPLSDIDPLATLLEAPLWLHLTHLGNPRWSCHLKILNHFCKVLFVVLGNMFIGSGERDMAIFGEKGIILAMTICIRTIDSSENVTNNKMIFPSLNSQISM